MVVWVGVLALLGDFEVDGAGDESDDEVSGEGDCDDGCGCEIHVVACFHLRSIFLDV